MKYQKEFENFLENEDRSSRTIRSYIDSLNKLENWLSGNYGINDLAIVSLRKIKEYREYLNAKYAPTSVNQKLSAIKTFYSFLLLQKVIQNNPCNRQVELNNFPQIRLNSLAN